MPDNASSQPLRKAAGLFPAVILLLLLQAWAEGAAPWYFLPTFGHDVRRVQGFADGYFATAGTPSPRSPSCAPRWRRRSSTGCWRFSAIRRSSACGGRTSRRTGCSGGWSHCRPRTRHVFWGVSPSIAQVTPVGRYDGPRSNS